MTAELLLALQTFCTKTAVEFAINFVTALLILLMGYWLSGRASAAMRRLMDRTPRVDPTLKPLAATIARQAVLVVTVLAVLARFGVETSSLIAVLGAAGLAIGLALQGTLSNVAAGVMLLVLRPFSVGEFIEVAGRSGTVKQIGLFTVELTNIDNLYVSLPNSLVFNAPIVNFTRNPTRRMDLTIGIDYGDDIDLAFTTAMAVMLADERVLAEPPPVVAVRALGESSVDLAVRCHMTTENFWPTQFALIKAIKQAFDAEGITIPFPQRTLSLAVEEQQRVERISTAKST